MRMLDMAHKEHGKLAWAPLPNVAEALSALDVQEGGDHYKKLGALAMGLRLDLALDPCAADIDARPVTCPQ